MIPRQRFELGVVLPLNQQGPERATVHWPELRELARRAEELGFDTIWTPEETDSGAGIAGVG